MIDVADMVEISRHVIPKTEWGEHEPIARCRCHPTREEESDIEFYSEYRKEWILQTVFYHRTFGKYSTPPDYLTNTYGANGIVLDNKTLMPIQNE